MTMAHLTGKVLFPDVIHKSRERLLQIGLHWFSSHQAGYAPVWRTSTNKPIFKRVTLRSRGCVTLSRARYLGSQWSLEP